MKLNAAELLPLVPDAELQRHHRQIPGKPLALSRERENEAAAGSAFALSQRVKQTRRLPPHRCLPCLDFTISGRACLIHHPYRVDRGA